MHQKNTVRLSRYVNVLELFINGFLKLAKNGNS